MATVEIRDDRLRELCGRRGLIRPTSRKQKALSEAFAKALSSGADAQLEETAKRYGLLSMLPINQRGLAQSIGVHEATLSRILIGQTPVSAAAIAGMLTFFEVPFEDLFELTPGRSKDARIEAAS